MTCPFEPNRPPIPTDVPRTAINGKNQEILPLGAVFAHNGDAGFYQKWNKSIRNARHQPIPALQQSQSQSHSCTVWEVGAHKSADASAEHMERYPTSCNEYHAYEPIPSYADALREKWANEPRMHIHAYGLAITETSHSVSPEQLQGLATYIGDNNKEAAVGGAAATAAAATGGSSSSSITAQIKSFDFALGESSFPTLLDINCEGCEYDFLLQAKAHGFLKKVKVILISWHAYGQSGVGARAWQLCQVRVALSETHNMVYGLGFGWERWVLKE